MDDIRTKILKEQQLRKARLANHFNEAFKNSAESTEENEIGKNCGEDKKPLKKAMTIDSIDDAFDILSKAGEEDLFEKAKHQIGDVHPNGKWVWTEYTGRDGNTKQEWRAIKKPKNAPAAGGSGSAAPAAKHGDVKTQTQNASGGKTWDKLSDFHVDGSDEKALWDNWYKFQTMGNPHFMNKMTEIFEKKFPHVAEWRTSMPNTGKSIITAKDANGETIAALDLAGKTIKLDKLQTFMDKCHESKTVKKTDDKKQNKNIDSKEQYEIAAKGVFRQTKGHITTQADIIAVENLFNKHYLPTIKDKLDVLDTNGEELKWQTVETSNNVDGLSTFYTVKNSDGEEDYYKIEVDYNPKNGLFEIGSVYKNGKSFNFSLLPKTTDKPKSINNKITRKDILQGEIYSNGNTNIFINKTYTHDGAGKVVKYYRAYFVPNDFKYIREDFKDDEYAPFAGYNSYQSFDPKGEFSNKYEKIPNQNPSGERSIAEIRRNVKEILSKKSLTSNNKKVKIKPSYSPYTGDLDVRQIILDRYPDLKNFKNGGTKSDVESVGYDYDEINDFKSKLNKINRISNNFIDDEIRADKELNNGIGKHFSTKDQTKTRAQLTELFYNDKTSVIRAAVNNYDKKDSDGKTKIQKLTEEYKKLLSDDAPQLDILMKSIKIGKLLYKRAFMTGLLKKREYIESELKKLK
jgi:hypothetical protein